MKALFTAWWEERNAREKRILTVGLVFIALLIFYQIMVAPALNGRAAIRSALPDMKHELANMQSQTAEARQLAGTAQSVSPTGDSLSSAVSSSLTDRGMHPEKVQLIGGAVQVDLKNISFATWVGWLNDMRRQLKIQVTQASVKPTNTEGRVDASVTLDSAQNSRAAR